MAVCCTQIGLRPWICALINPWILNPLVRMVAHLSGSCAEPEGIWTYLKLTTVNKATRPHNSASA